MRLQSLIQWVQHEPGVLCTTLPVLRYEHWGTNLQLKKWQVSPMQFSFYLPRLPLLQFISAYPFLLNQRFWAAHQTSDDLCFHLFVRQLITNKMQNLILVTNGTCNKKHRKPEIPKACIIFHWDRECCPCGLTHQVLLGGDHTQHHCYLIQQLYGSTSPGNHSHNFPKSTEVFLLTSACSDLHVPDEDSLPPGNPASSLPAYLVERWSDRVNEVLWLAF